MLTARNVLGSSVPFLISQFALDSFAALLKQFGLHASLVGLPADPSTAIHVPRLYLVTGARQDDKFDSERLEELVVSLPRAPGSTLRGDLFLSRAHLPQPQLGNRPLVNRTAIEDAFLREGYRLVYPEEHSIAEMSQMVQGASHLAGEDGSALHNVLWRPRRLVCLGHADFAVNLHLRLCDALGVDYVYVGGEPAALAHEEGLYPRDRSWSIPAHWLHDVLHDVQDRDRLSAPGLAVTRSDSGPTSHVIEASFWGVDHRDVFGDDLQQLMRKHFGVDESIFAGDNLITIGRALSIFFGPCFYGCLSLRRFGGKLYRSGNNLASLYLCLGGA